MKGPGWVDHRGQYFPFFSEHPVFVAVFGILGLAHGLYQMFVADTPRRGIFRIKVLGVARPACFRRIAPDFGTGASFNVETGGALVPCRPHANSA